MNYNEINFPIKYALMPLYKLDRLDYRGYSTYYLAYYLPMPCYLIKESKTCQEDGSIKMEYEVVFFTRNTEPDFLNNKQQLPEFNFNGRCRNSNIVTSFYENYESAKEAGETEDEYYPPCLKALPLEALIEKSKEIKEEIASRYEFIENEILSKPKQKVLK